MKVKFTSTIPVFSLYIAKGMFIGFMLFMAVFAFIALPAILDGATFSSFTPDIYFAMGFVGLIFFFTYVVMAIVFPKGFMFQVVIDETGVYQTSMSPTKAVNTAAIVGGILSKSPGAVGAGLLAQAGDARHLSWSEIKIAKINNKSRYCYFSKGRFGLFPIGFYCPEKYFDEVKATVKNYFSTK